MNPLGLALVSVCAWSAGAASADAVKPAAEAQAHKTDVGQAINVLHFSQTIIAQPDPNRVSQDVFPAFRDPLAPPADFQRADNTADIFPHLNPFAGCHNVFHRAS